MGLAVGRGLRSGLGEGSCDGQRREPGPFPPSALTTVPTSALSQVVASRNAWNQRSTLQGARRPPAPAEVGRWRWTEGATEHQVKAAGPVCRPLRWQSFLEVNYPPFKAARTPAEREREREQKPITADKLGFF